ncbi:MAG: hypothetical protein ABI356_06150 [Steroidobacteraceae bacterium]
MRRGAILGLLWTNVDLEKRVAHLLLTKNGDSRGMPLSSRAVAIFRAVPPSTIRPLPPDASLVS